MRCTIAPSRCLYNFSSDGQSRCLTGGPRAAVGHTARVVVLNRTEPDASDATELACGGGHPSVDGRCSPDQGELKARYLVDPASSHMLVSKIKPCMSKYKLT